MTRLLPILMRVLKDVGTNPTDAVNGIPVSESADVIVPTV